MIEDQVDSAIAIGDVASLRGLLGADAAHASWFAQHVPYALHRAAENNHVELATYLLEAYPSSVNADCGNGETPVMTAAFFNNPEAIRVLIAHGADIDRRDHQGFSALFRAARGIGIQGHASIGLLIAAGAYIDPASAILLSQDELLLRVIRFTPDLFASDAAFGDLVSFFISSGKINVAAEAASIPGSLNSAAHAKLPIIAAMSHSGDDMTNLVRLFIRLGASTTLDCPVEKCNAIEWARRNAYSYLSILQPAEQQ